MSEKGKKHKVTLQLAPAIDGAIEDDEVRGEEEPLVLPPLLVSFPHGQPPESTLQSLDFQGVATEARPGQKRRRVCLTGDTDYVKYQCVQPAVSRKALGDYLVGVYDKETEEVVLYPAHAILAMEQRVKSQESDVEDNPADTDLTYLERRKSLVEGFGTKKKRKSLKSREDNRIKSESVVGLKALGRFLDDATREAQEADEAEATVTGDAALEASRSSLLPPYNRLAKTPAGVYRAREIITEDEWDALAEQVDELLAQCQQEEEGTGDFTESLLSGYKYWPSFVRERLQQLGAPTDPDKRDTAICLLYIRHLMEFHRGPHVYRGDVTTLANSIRVPEILVSRFLSTFAVSETRPGQSYSLEGEKEAKLERHQRTKTLRDKLLLYILVMHLIVCDFAVPASRVAADLAMPDVAVVPLFKQVGCTVAKKYRSGDKGKEEDQPKGKKNQELVAQLTVPLKFPALKKPIMRKKS